MTVDGRRFHLIVVLAGVVLGMTAPLTALYAKGFGASDTAAGFAVSVISVALLVADVFGTRVIPNVDGRGAISSALGIFGLFSVVEAAASGYWMMVAGRVLQGFGAALFLGAALQLAVKRSPVGQEGRSIGRLNAAWFGGVAVGPLLGGLTSALAGGGQGGLRAAFGACAVLGLSAGAVAWVVLPPLPTGRACRVGLPRFARPDARLGGSLLLSAFGQAARAGVVLTILPLFADQSLGLSALGVTGVLTALAVTDILSMTMLGSLADRHGRRPYLVVALVLGALGAVVGAGAGDVGTFVVCCTVLGVAAGTSWVIPAAMVVDCSPALEREPALAAYRVVADVGMLVGATAAGALVDARGSGGALVWAGVFLLVGATGAVLVGETRVAPSMTAVI